MMNQQNTGFLSGIPPVTKNLIIINTIFWVASLVLPKVGIDLVELLGLHILGANHFNPVQFVSYMFMHDTHSVMHLFFNMFAVFMFGRALEILWGSKRFLLFYLITGVGAGIVQELTWLWSLRDLLFSSIDMVNLNGEQIITKKEYLDYFVTIGASGSVFGVLLAFGMNFPNAPLYIMFIPVPVKAKYVVAGYGLVELFAGIVHFSGDSVAHFAHLGGMLFGFFIILYWKKKYPGDGSYF